MTEENTFMLKMESPASSQTMKAVVLDSDTVTGGDVSLKAITSIIDTNIYGFTPDSQAAQRIGNAEIVLTNKVRITKEVMELCPNIKYIGVFATGYNNIDISCAKERGIVVSNVPGYSTDSVAQHTFALILNYYSSVCAYDRTVKNGDWCYSKLFSYFDIPLFELSGKTIGIIGYGAIGRAVAKIAAAFNMNILVCTRSYPKDDCGIKAVTLEELLRESDIVTLHCPLTDKTAELINKDTISLMKETAILINTSRGGVINENDLAQALNSGRIAAAGLDVLTKEPMQLDCPLRTAQNCTFTPHIAWAPLETRKRLIEMVKNNIKAFLDGSPINNVAK